MHFSKVKHLLLSACIFICISWYPTRIAETNRAGQSIPRVTFINEVGDTIRTQDLEGKIVYVNFWASWSKNSRKLNQQQIDLYDKLRAINFKNKNEVVFISISLDINPGYWKLAKAQDDLHWPNNVCDSKGWKSTYIEAFGVKHIPCNFIYDQRGKLLHRNVWNKSLDSILVSLNNSVSN